jgi:DNA-binding winged helix-turn-helix (wHTH) protein/tetratricopeptide (TPR) repeat protein
MSRPIYRFGDCTIDASARELRNGGALATLSPKVFDCLIYLIEHRDRAVGRDELIAAVWGKTEVTDTLLGQTVLKARRAVDDSGNGQNVIRTIPRFGYRWVADIAVDDGSAAPTEPYGPTSTPSAPAVSAGSETPDVAAGSTVRSRAARIGIPAAVGVALVIGASAWLAASRRPAATVRAPEATPASAAAGASANGTAAVLPVVVAGGDEWAWLRLGLMDLIASRLRQAGQAVVPSDNVVALMRAGNGAASAQTAQRAVLDATGARFVVVPKVAHGADAWSVDIELRMPDGTTRSTAAQGPDPIDTARTAADRLLALLGKTPPLDPGRSGELSLAELQQRTEAALLNDDFATARRLVDTAPEALRNTPVMRLRLGQIEFRSGQLAPARSTLDALLAETPAETVAVLRARALYNLGGVSLRQDRNDDAIRAFDEAIALTATRDEPGVLGQAYTGLAAAEVNIGKFDDAADNLGRARVAVELAGDKLQLARVDANEGVLDNARGRHAEALPILQRARALAAAGRLTDARNLLDDLARTTRPEQTGLPGDVASESARVYLETGDTAAAIEAARAAVDRLPTIDQARARARAWLTWTRALRAAGRVEDARDQVAAFAHWAATHDAMPSVTLFAALAAAEQARAEGRRQEEARSYALALADAERWAVPADLAAVAVSYARSLIAESDFERASAVTGRVARWADRDFDCALLQAGLYHALGQRSTWQSALARARALAGERPIPRALLDPPTGQIGASS